MSNDPRVRSAPAARFAALFAALGALSACAASRPAFVLPTPPAWKTEANTLPPSFAPTLPHRGKLELRFPPGFMDPAAGAFWSYTFLWWLDGAPDVDAAGLAGDLRIYYAGLAGTAPEYDARATPGEAQLVATAGGFEGWIATFDPFATKAPIRLNVHVRRVACRAPGGGATALVFQVSPRPATDPVWHELGAVADGFTCDPTRDPQK